MQCGKCGINIGKTFFMYLLRHQCRKGYCPIYDKIMNIPSILKKVYEKGDVSGFFFVFLHARRNNVKQRRLYGWNIRTNHKSALQGKA